MLLVRFVKNTKFDANFRAGWVKVSFSPQGSIPSSAGAKKEKKPLKLFSIILDPSLNQKVHLIQLFNTQDYRID